MNDFLTVEDINTINVNHQVTEVYSFDLSLLDSEEYTDVVVDFFKCSHQINGIYHDYYIEIDNTAWNGAFYFKYPNDSYVKIIEITNRIVHFSTTSINTTIYIGLYSFDKTFNKKDLKYILLSYPIVYLKKNEIGESREFNFLHIHSNTESTYSFNLNKGVNILKINNDDAGEILCLLQKTDLVFDLNNVDLAVGSVNHVPLGVDSHYLPSGDLVDGDELDAVVIFNGEELPVVFDSTVNDYCFDLDLTDKRDNRPINLTLKVYESKYINRMESKFNLPCHYEHASSFNELTRLLSRNVEIIELTEDLIVNNNILLGYDCLIKGNDSELDLDNHSIFIADGVNVKLQNINFINGKPTIIQKNDSKLEITDCGFTDCSITDDYKGSVLSTYESENIITNITSTSIYNCPHSIWHDGELSISKLTATYDKIDNVDTDYSMFLTKYDGIVEISNSVFNIDFDTNALCSEQINLKYAQSLFSISETVQINGLSGNKLKQNNILNIFDNNVSNINATYYYPKIEACVRIKSDIRDKACCHHIIGTDWIFKNNTLLERL